MNVIHDGENNFPQKLLITDAQVSMICKAFANGSTANIKFLMSKNQMPKMVQFSTPAPFSLIKDPLPDLFTTEIVNSNKTGLFECSFFWEGVSLISTTHFIFQEELI